MTSRATEVPRAAGDARPKPPSADSELVLSREGETMSAWRTDDTAALVARVRVAAEDLHKAQWWVDHGSGNAHQRGVCEAHLRYARTDFLKIVQDVRALCDTIERLTAERDRYREALQEIARTRDLGPFPDYHSLSGLSALALGMFDVALALKHEARDALGMPHEDPEDT